jgi:hypothetical protein
LDVRASAIAAVDAAENSIKTKAPRIETILTPGIPLVQVPGPSAGVTAPQTGVCDTELSAELCSFPDISTNIKLVTLQAASAVMDTASALAPTTSGVYCFPCEFGVCVCMCVLLSLPSGAAQGCICFCSSTYLPGSLCFDVFFLCFTYLFMLICVCVCISGHPQLIYFDPALTSSAPHPLIHPYGHYINGAIDSKTFIGCSIV